MTSKRNVARAVVGVVAGSKVELEVVADVAHTQRTGTGVIAREHIAHRTIVGTDRHARGIPLLRSTTRPDARGSPSVVDSRAARSWSARVCHACGMSRPASPPACSAPLTFSSTAPCCGASPCEAGPPASSWWRWRRAKQSALIDITAMRTWVERVPGLQLDGHDPSPTSWRRASELLAARARRCCTSAAPASRWARVPRPCSRRRSATAGRTPAATGSRPSRTSARCASGGRDGGTRGVRGRHRQRHRGDASRPSERAGLPEATP